MTEKDVKKYLGAFADGELDVTQNLSMLEHMAMDPRATRRVMHQQQLRQAVDRHIRGQTPSGGAPDELRARIARLMEATPPAVKPGKAPGSEAPGSEARPVLYRFRPLWGAALAALVAIVAVLSVQWMTRTAGPRTDILSVVQFDHFITRHMACTQRLEELWNAARFPTDVAALPAELTAYLGQSPDVPLDLSALGYRYAGAGECDVPAHDSAHLVYLPLPDSGHTDRMSLWIAPASPRIHLEPDRLYSGTIPDRGGTMIFWRRGGLIYYLVGDSAVNVQRVAQTLVAG